MRRKKWYDSAFGVGDEDSRVGATLVVARFLVSPMVVVPFVIAPFLLARFMFLPVMRAGTRPAPTTVALIPATLPPGEREKCDFPAGKPTPLLHSAEHLSRKFYFVSRGTIKVDELRCPPR
ncbi:MAG: hypothetical protein ACUVTH_11155 [Thermogutta sp.]